MPSIRLPDVFHRPGAFFVRVGGYVKVGSACGGEKVTAAVKRLRVPKTIAHGESEPQRLARFLGAFLVEDAAVKRLVDALHRATGQTGVGDWYALDDAELEALLARVSGRHDFVFGIDEDGAPIEVPYRVSRWRPDSSSAEVRTTTLLSGDKAEARRKLHEVERAMEAHRVEQKAALRRRGDDRGRSSDRERNPSPSESNETQRPARSGAPTKRAGLTRTYRTGPPIETGSARGQGRSVRSDAATGPQYDCLVALGATVNVDRETFTTCFSRRDAVSAIDTQKAGVRHVIIERGYRSASSVGPQSKSETERLLAFART